MTLPASGAISFAAIANELVRPNTALSLNDADVRTLADKATGAVSLSDLLGKFAGVTIVAGQNSIMTTTYRGYTLSFGSTGAPLGSISGALIGIGGALTTCYDEGASAHMTGKMVFVGNIAAELTGKKIYINDVEFTPLAPTVASQRTFLNLPDKTAFGFVNGGTYRVQIR